MALFTVPLAAFIHVAATVEIVNLLSFFVHSIFFAYAPLAKLPNIQIPANVMNEYRYYSRYGIRRE